MSQQALKLFISYSHADKKHHDNFIKHLASLKRSGCISAWSDRELIAGDNLDEEIKSELNSADIIAFLISPDFLNSFYCIEIELMETLNRLTDYQIRIVPIIVECCDWKDGVINQFVAIPPDGQPISKHDDANEAWLGVIQKIKKVREKLLEVRHEGGAPIIATKSFPEMSESFSEDIRSTEIVFSHQHKEVIHLDDVFVFPDMKLLIEEYDKLEAINNAERLTDLSKLDDRNIIIGDEQTGKTSLAKMLIRHYFQQGALPLYLDASSVRKTQLDKALSPSVKHQYILKNFDEFKRVSAKKILIVDDFHAIKLNEKYQGRFLELLEDAFDKVIIFADKTLKFIESEFVSFSEYIQYEMLLFGHEKRYELINKWNSLGKEETIPLKELQALNDYSQHHINAIIRKNVVPSKPIFILTLLQSLEFRKKHETSLTSYGHCYQHLIMQALEKVKIKAKEIDPYINYLTEISFFIFERGRQEITSQEFEEFKREYSASFLIPCSHDELLGHLIDSKILVAKEDRLRFAYKYIFYFYAAKKLAETIHDKKTKEVVSLLCENLHTEVNANILIFLTHHSKDEAIIDDILLYTSALFDGLNQSTLDSKDTEFFEEFLQAIPNLVMEQRSVEEERKRSLKSKDQELDNTHTVEENENEPLGHKGMFAQINASARAVEVIGQILRNRYGSLRREQLNDLAESAYSVGLRFLEFYLNLANKIQSDIEAMIKSLIESEDKKISDEEVAKRARKLFLSLCYGVSFSVVNKIATSIGFDKLMPIFEELSSQNNSPSYQLIEIAISLEFTKQIPKNKISVLFNEFSSNRIAKRMLQEIVLQHSYLHYLDFDDKQWISETLGIPMQVQRAIGWKTEAKVIK